MQRWINAWQEKDTESYLNNYVDTYTALKHLSASQWRQMRVERIMQPAWIRIETGPIAITREADKVRLDFWLLYRSVQYQDNTRKSLLLSRDAGAWKIEEELNLEVLPLQD